jgi:catechol 2,3-dioxygenase-like lactoylglutathione lyase family enzyme
MNWISKLLAASLAFASATANAETPAAPTQPATMLMGVGFATADLNRTLHFYRDGIGMVELTRLPLGEVVEVILGFDRGSKSPPNIMLLGRADGKPLAGAGGAAGDKTVLSVSDVAAVSARLTAAGFAPAPIRANPAMDVSNFFVTDPDGHRLEIVQLGRSHQPAH